ncbi:MAG TPA: hypothetical protein VFF78_07985 [Anaerolineaceae bacterium]|nr:hypothetical protein [Anaerolineaceae bacterium]
MMEYAGAEWIERQLACNTPLVQMSPLGHDVADLLGELFRGIYHIEHQALRVDWSNKQCISINIDRALATFDFRDLTHLVFLAHHLCLRVEIEPCNFRFLRILFWRRSRDGDISKRHPTLREAVERFEEHVSIPEVK